MGIIRDQAGQERTGCNVYRTTKGSKETTPLLFGVKTVLWPRMATRAKGGRWYRGVVEGGGLFYGEMEREGGGEELATALSSERQT